MPGLSYTFPCSRTRQGGGLPHRMDRICLQRNAPERHPIVPDGPPEARSAVRLSHFLVPAHLHRPAAQGGLSDQLHDREGAESGHGIHELRAAGRGRLKGHAAPPSLGMRGCGTRQPWLHSNIHFQHGEARAAWPKHAPCCNICRCVADCVAHTAFPGLRRSRSRHSLRVDHVKSASAACWRDIRRLTSSLFHASVIGNIPVPIQH